MRVAVPTKHGSPGGPATFERNLVEGLQRRGAEVVRDLDAAALDAVLLVNSTRRLDKVVRARSRGAAVVQRLGSILAPEKHRGVSLRARAYAHAANASMRLVRRRIADAVVYQTDAVRRRWAERYRAIRTPEQREAEQRRARQIEAALLSVNGIDPLPNKSPIQRFVYSYLFPGEKLRHVWVIHFYMRWAMSDSTNSQ